MLRKLITKLIDICVCVLNKIKARISPEDEVTKKDKGEEITTIINNSFSSGEPLDKVIEENEKINLGRQKNADWFGRSLVLLSSINKATKKIVKIVKLICAFGITLNGFIILASAAFEYKIDTYLLSIDKILIALTILITGEKTFDLIFGKDEKDIDEIDVSVLNMAVITLALLFLTKAIGISDDSLSFTKLLRYGISFGIIIAAISLYKFVKQKNGNSK